MGLCLFLESSRFIGFRLVEGFIVGAGSLSRKGRNRVVLRVLVGSSGKDVLIKI